MIGQPAMTANPADILYCMRVTMFVTLLCLGYELSHPTPAIDEERYFLLSSTNESASQDKEWPDLPSWQRMASEKAIERYAATQEKKWRRWNEAMFERSA